MERRPFDAGVPLANRSLCAVSNLVASRHIDRPGVVTGLAVYYLIGGILCGILFPALAVLGFMGMVAEKPDASAAEINFLLFMAILMGGGSFIYAAAYVIAGIGLLNVRPWAQTMNLILSILGALHLNPLTFPGLICAFMKSFKDAFERPEDSEETPVRRPRVRTRQRRPR